jgi:hypothetical protein
MRIVVKNPNIVAKYFQLAVAIVFADGIAHFDKCKPQDNGRQVNEKSSLELPDIENKKKEMQQQNDRDSQRQKTGEPEIFRRNKYAEVADDGDNEKKCGKRFFHCLIVIVKIVIGALIDPQNGSLK